MASLSLYFFNLLPLPLLDGTQLFDAILELQVLRERLVDIDLEAIEVSRKPSLGRWKYLRTTVRIITPIMCTGSVVLSIFHLR